MLKNYNKAFTLVELLVVIAIVGLLSTIVLAVTSGVSEQGRIAKGLQFSKHLENSLGDHLIGRWTFDETADLCGTNKVCDTSGWDNHGTINGATIVDNDTPSGQGKFLSFDGDDYVDAGPNVNLVNNNPFTYSTWIKFSTSQLSRTIMGKHNDLIGGASMGIDTVANKIKFHLNLYGSQRVNSTMTLNDNTWHHIVGTWDGDIIKLYIDGSINASSDVPNTLTFPAINFQIGRWVGGASQYFNGLVDEVCIYSTALTASQIQSQYYVGLDRLLAKGLIDEQEYQERLTLK
jgi:prepilin-type N-terminal cleavage/methylation domain-containing protein